MSGSAHTVILLTLIILKIVPFHLLVSTFSLITKGRETHKAPSHHLGNVFRIFLGQHSSSADLPFVNRYLIVFGWLETIGMSLCLISDGVRFDRG